MSFSVVKDNSSGCCTCLLRLLRRTTGGCHIPSSAAGGQRATSNVNTASRTNRLVGAATNATPAATNQRPGRQAAAANPVFRNAATSSISPKSSKATGKAVSPKPRAPGANANAKKPIFEVA